MASGEKTGISKGCFEGKEINICAGKVFDYLARKSFREVSLWGTEVAFLP